MKKIKYLFLIFLVFILTSCGHIEDQNGVDDYSVVTISDETIISRRMNTSNMGSFYTTKDFNNKLSGTYRVNKLSGIVEFRNFNVGSRYLSFEFDFTCTSGNALVAIVSNNKIVKKVEANSKVEFEVTNNGHEYYILLVGERAKAKVSYTIKAYN